MCYGGDGGTTYGADFNPTGECGDYVPAKVELGPHVAALGMRIYPADAAAAAAAGGGVGLAASASGGGASGLFPAEYRSKMFIAEHGSWNRRSAIGYRVMVSDGVSTYEEFFSFMDADGAYCGRPVDVHVLRDGSLLVSDDHAGALYRVVYTGGEPGR